MCRRVVWWVALLLAANGLCAEPKPPADEFSNRLEKVRQLLIQQFSVPIESWRCSAEEVQGAEQAGFDDSAWQSVKPDFSWSGSNTRVWLRARAVIPDSIAGQPVEGLPVHLIFGAGESGELFIDGRLREWYHWDTKKAAGVQYTLVEKARAGQPFQFAVHSVGGKKSGKFYLARLYFDVVPEFEAYRNDVEFLGQLLGVAPLAQRESIRKILAASEAEITATDVTRGNVDAFRLQIAAARKVLEPVAAITRRYDVYYVGHAHIDMNWLWPWEETIDVCHRTWNTAMNLMDEFPEFHFVQSQPGAYGPIEERYPDEFSRIREKVAGGQWDLVGGMWNESDDNMASGEGLVRSLVLGQTYFKEKFGRYAVTGWLPDSFGHNWQMPQLLQLAGMKYFYHMRCANGLDFTWWQAPDGSRVLKANSVTSYDTNVEVSQLARPWENEARCQTAQSLVVFGVGDHGGGATREQILAARAFQRDPILPRVHFTSADDFFDQLASQPSAAALPVMDGDLQYFDEGCYTTHADIKKAVRGIENALYTAETLSTLAALAGTDYSSQDFTAAWKPAAFAQFHDILAGSAIHSTYDWMHEQLGPSFQTAADQTKKALAALTEAVDTRGPSAQAIVVWNSLSFARDDVVHVTLPDGVEYRSVVDREGQSRPIQRAKDGSWVFVARDVPAFGCRVYFPSDASCVPDGIALKEESDDYEITTPTLGLQIAKETGALTHLRLLAGKWSVLDKTPDGNAFEIVEDTGNAWHIRYTGKHQILSTEGAKVQVLDKGPVFVRVRVEHSWDKSSYMQDITVYGALPRVDIPTTIDWHELHQTAKIRLPINAASLQAQAEIPFGSIVRPVNGQECPGQKWMEVSAVEPSEITNGFPLDLSKCFDAQSGDNFDGEGRSFPVGQMPMSGVHPLGSQRIPFRLATGQPAQPDYFAAASQRVAVPPQARGDTLFLLGAGVSGGQWGAMGFRRSDGSVESRAFAFSDWQRYRYPDNSAGMRDAMTTSFAENSPGLTCPAPPLKEGSKTEAPLNLWIVSIPLPKGTKELIFPANPQMRIFGAAVGSAPPSRIPHGLSILNDSKYAFDVSGNVFRLTALRSSDKPDPLPDTGRQSFVYSLYPHTGTWQAAKTDEQALALNIPLVPVVAGSHPPNGKLPRVILTNKGGKGNLIVSAWKKSEDGKGYILRFYESQGQNTEACVKFDHSVEVAETDLLERPFPRHVLTTAPGAFLLPVGHNQIVTLRVINLK